jgi:predicted  nucleic acid-binding Zn-ribbon protein
MQRRVWELKTLKTKSSKAYKKLNRELLVFKRRRNKSQTKIRRVDSKVF